MALSSYPSSRLAPHPVVFSPHPVVFSPHPVVFSQGFLTRDELRALRSTCREYYTDLQPLQTIEAQRIIGHTTIQASFLVLEKVATFVQAVHLQSQTQDLGLIQSLCDACTATPDISYKGLASVVNGRLGFNLPYYDPLVFLVYKNTETSNKGRAFILRELEAGEMIKPLPEELPDYVYRDAVIEVFRNALQMINETHSSFYKFIWLLAIVDHMLKTPAGRYFFLEQPRFTRAMLEKLKEFDMTLEEAEAGLIDRVQKTHTDLMEVYRLFRTFTVGDA